MNDYLTRQRAFWNTPNLEVARFQRVHTDGERSESAWRELASRDAAVLFEGLEPMPDWTILEIGCGVGRIVEVLQRQTHFGRYVGVDISESMISFARQCVGMDPRCELYVNNGHALPMVADGVIDFGYAVDVFIHIYDVDVVGNYLREISRVLNNAGRFRLNVRRWDPKRAFGGSLGGRIARSLYETGIWSAGEHRWRPGERTGFDGNQYTANDLRRIVGRSGLRITSMTPRPDQIWCTLGKV